MSEQPVSPAEVAWFAQRCDLVVRNVERVIRGKTDIIRLAVLCLAAEGHLLLNDVPGVGKTSIAKALAKSIAGTMRRIQCTPDLLPTDVTGINIWNADTRTFEFQPGPVFANVVLADEVNRSSPKTQSALLEVMEERQVTLDGTAYGLERPFLVIATQNPVEHGGTFDLPEAQIDRFMMRLAVGYPGHEAEVDMLASRSAGQSVDDLTPVVSAADVQQMTAVVRRVHVSRELLSYVVTVADATRRRAELRLGASPRGGLALVVAAQAHAAAEGRAFVIPDDVKRLAPHVLGHRLLLRPEAELNGVTAEKLLGSVLVGVPVPGERPAFR